MSVTPLPDKQILDDIAFFPALGLDTVLTGRFDENIVRIGQCQGIAGLIGFEKMIEFILLLGFRQTGLKLSSTFAACLSG